MSPHKVSVVGADGKVRQEAADGRPLAALMPEGGGFVWAHVNFGTAAGRAWIDASGLDPVAAASLVAEETRPRCAVDGDLILMNLRGMNLNPGAEPEDMVSLRLVAGRGMLVTSLRRNLIAIDDVMAGLKSGRAPASPGDLLSRIAIRLADRAEPVVGEMMDQMDDLEDAADAELTSELRARLADLRSAALKIRRFMLPQREALTTLDVEDPDWMSRHDKSRLREATERVTRLGEELDAIRDRAQVVRDSIADRRAEMMNQRMMLLAVVTAIFLPLGLITGLLGINVGGIPGQNSHVAFWVVAGTLVVLAGGLLLLFWRLAWIR